MKKHTIRIIIFLYALGCVAGFILNIEEPTPREMQILERGKEGVGY